MPHNATLSAHDIACQRGGHLLFENLSFTLVSGQALLITGPNGAGKTSLLRMIAGLLPLHAGRFEAGQADVPLAELCHYVGHLNAIKTTLTLRDNFRFWVEFLGGDESAFEPGLSSFGLQGLADLPAGLLSAGQKRKLALLRLLAAQRPIWLLDEPSVSLDVASTVVLAKAIANHLKGGGIALVASHTPLRVKFAENLALEGRMIA